jgi:hypothetical protein
MTLTMSETVHHRSKEYQCTDEIMQTCNAAFNWHDAPNATAPPFADSNTFSRSTSSQGLRLPNPVGTSALTDLHVLALAFPSVDVLFRAGERDLSPLNAKHVDNCCLNLSLFSLFLPRMVLTDVVSKPSQ